MLWLCEFASKLRLVQLPLIPAVFNSRFIGVSYNAELHLFSDWVVAIKQALKHYQMQELSAEKARLELEKGDLKVFTRMQHLVHAVNSSSLCASRGR